VRREAAGVWGLRPPFKEKILFARIPKTNWRRVYPVKPHAIVFFMRLFIATALFCIGLCAPALAAFDSAEFAENKELRILRVTPEGADVPVGRQIVIQFNRPVVPIGSMERASTEIPVEIEPKLECQWRWLNTSALSCNLDEKNELKAATSYRMMVNQGIKAEDGETIKEAFHHQFTTERPDVSYAWFRKWLSPSTPVMRLTFNQPVTKKSVESSMFFAPAEGTTNQRYKLEVQRDPDDEESPSYPQQGGEEARRVWLITPKDELPLDAAMSLKVKPGLISALGSEKGIGDREEVRFQTFPEFKFLGVTCTSNENTPLLFAPDKVEAGLCNPMASSSLVFSSPVLRSQIKNNILFTPSINLNADDDPWGDGEDNSRITQAHEKGRTYDIDIPSGIKAATEYTVKSKSPDRDIFQKIWFWIQSFFTDVADTDIRDEFNRPLQKRINLAFKTNHRKPNFEIIHNTAVLEGQIDSEVPLYVNNLNKTTFSYRKLTAEGAKTGLSFMQDIPKVQDLQFAIPFNIRGMLGGKSGAVYGHLGTDPLVSKSSADHRLFAQVTPYQLHLKLGHFNSIVWVTDMASGQPVANAKVSIYKDKISELSGDKQPLSQAVTSADGVAILEGTEKFDPSLELYDRWNDDEERLFIRVDKDGEMALLPVSNAFEIDSYRSVGESVYADNKERYGHIQAWGTTAQGIYRAGDTIQYKFYVRDQNNRTLSAAPQSGYHLEIIDPTGNKVQEEKAVTLGEFGDYSGEFTTSKQGAVGWYQFRLTADFDKTKSEDNAEEEEEGEAVEGKFTWFPIRVLVSDFTPSPFKVTNQVNGDLFRAEQNVEVATLAKLHSGGAYTDANLRVTAMLESKTFTSQHPVAKDFLFGSYIGDEGQEQVFQKDVRVDGKGENSLSFKLPQQSIYYGRLMFESAVQDDRGKHVAAQSYADYAGVDRFVGLKTNDWIFESGKPAHIYYLVADERGKPTAGTKVNIAIERQETKAAKVKGAGNAYVTEFTNEWVSASHCSGKSKESASICEFTPKEAGYYRTIATIKDTKGNEHTTEISMYVVGKGHVLWNESNDYSLEIVPEKPTYKVGEKARYLIKNPYPNAKALVTIERYGVLDRFVQTLEGSTPMIEFEVKPDYIPGFYLSVVAFSPRVDKPIEGQVDLGKPAFRIGYLTVPIQDQAKEVLVTAKTDREVYKPREKVKLSLHAEPRMNNTKEPLQLAVAVVDESVFDLVAGGKSYYDPYNGFYNLEGLDLRNYSLLTRLVGRQKFEKKGANSGGDGGSDLAMRNLFKFVSYWNPSLKTDAKGNAAVEFEVPDNLTGWRVLAMAVTPTDRMGLGDTNFKVNRPTEVRPVMPNQVTEGDNFEAGFSVMNRTDKKREIMVTVEASGNLDDKKSEALLNKKVVLEPYKRTTVWMPLQTKAVDASRDVESGAIHFRVTAEDALDGDGMEHTLTVHKRRSLETAANYGTTTKAKVEESIQFPDKIHADVGNVSVVAAPSVIGNIEGAFKYLRDYPYGCWEQKLTKGVMASHYINLRAYMPKDFTWKEAEKLPDETLKMAASFQAPSGGMAYFIPQDSYVDPYLSAYTALAFNWLRKSGYHIPTEVESKLHGYLDNLLKQDTYPDFYDEGMASTVRAVALAALAENNKITVADLERYRPHVAQMSLFGKNYFVQAAMHVKNAEEYVAEVSKLILSHANQSGGKFTFNEQLDDGYSRILSSPLRENCAILSTFTTLGERKEGQALVGDVPFKLVRMITQARGSRTYWENTQENVFCMNGLVDYARIYENVKPNMQVTVKLDDKPFGETKFADVQDAPITFIRNIEAADVGRKAKAVIERTGAGRLYYATRLSYAPLEEHSTYTNSGIEIRREYSVERKGKWEFLQSPSEIKQSELVRVDIFLSLPSARNFVVVDDPVPGGLEPVNRDLATASIVDADKEEFQAAGGSWWFKYSDWTSYNASHWSFYHKELRHDAVRFYSDYLPAGNYHLSYMAQAIAAGNFVIMPIHAEEMYDPDVYGKGVAEKLNVKGQQQ
jgi:uncharacterized protein YfaS (alpha-2-macroglobulin family)